MRVVGRFIDWSLTIMRVPFVLWRDQEQLQHRLATQRTEINCTAYDASLSGAKNLLKIHVTADPLDVSSSVCLSLYGCMHSFMSLLVTFKLTCAPGSF